MRLVLTEAWGVAIQGVRLKPWQSKRTADSRHPKKKSPPRAFDLPTSTFDSCVFFCSVTDG